MLASMLIIQFCVALLDELRSPDRDRAPALDRGLAMTTYVVGWVVLWLNGLDPALTSQLHAISVYVLVIATVALLVVALHRAIDEAALVTSAVLALEVGQGVLGWVQYLLDLPVLLVALHMLLAASLAAGFARIALAVRPHRAAYEADASSTPQQASATHL